MAFKPIKYEGKNLTIRKTIIEPDFNSRTILTSSPWEYVEMWLKRHKQKEALFYWEQAKNFSIASLKLPPISSPLTSYYSFLNATKTLLQVKKMRFSEQHGVTGTIDGNKASLINEKVKFQPNGVLAELCKYLNESSNYEEYSLKDLLYNLPYIHRSYNLTHKSQPELFIPISEPKFVKKTKSTESWFCATIKDDRYAKANIIHKLSTKYEREHGEKDKFIIRRKERFDWKYGKGERINNICELKKYHQKVRKDVYYIQGSERLWYIKKTNNIHGLIDRSSLTITFAVMHRLSELARYSPTRLVKHFESTHNWLLSEFINHSLYQFNDEISAEITGTELMSPGRR